MKELLRKIRESNIHLSLHNDNLQLHSDEPEIAPSLLQEIKDNKKRIIDYLKKNAAQKEDEPTIPLADPGFSYPLSSSQKRLWMLSQFREASLAYHIPGVFYFEGPVNIQALEQAFRQLIERHEILRTVFRKNEKEEVRQWIKPVDEIPFCISYLDLQENDSQATNVNHLVQQQIETTFDLAEGPLIRISLFQLKPQSYVFVSVMHHIISDGWSMGIMIRELLHLYQAFVSGEPDALPQTELQYKDFAVWQQERLKQGKLNDHRHFWLQQLEEPVTALDLPIDYSRPAIQSFRGRLFGQKLDARLTRRLGALCQASGATVYMGIVAVVKTLLHRYTGQTDIVIGSPVAGRVQAELEDQIGFYINTLPLRTRFSGDDSFSSLLANVRQVTLNAYEHQDYPLDRIIEDINLQRDGSRNPLFDVMAVLQNFDMGTRDSSLKSFGDIRIREYRDWEYITSKVDITFYFTETGSEFETVIEYNSDLFREETIRSMWLHLETLIEAVTADPEQPISRLNYLSGEEKEQLLFGFNATEAGFPADKSLADLFRQQANLHPDATAVIFEDRKISFRELDEQTNRLARLLRMQLHIKPEARIGILQNRGLELPVSIMGIIKAGGAYVPLDPDYPEDRLLNMIADSNIEIVLTDSKVAEFANRLQWRSKSIRYLICVDSFDIHTEYGGGRNELMSRELWDHVGQRSENAIASGGWMSSYTGMDLSGQEMKEYTDNIFLKLKDHINPDFKVLEIGCSSGLTMFRIAPYVGSYYGTDISSVILEKTQQEANRLNYSNIHLSCLPAHEIDLLGAGYFDLVIINSVVHCFNGHNYLHQVLSRAISMLKDKGKLFLGDLMDEDKRQELIADMRTFKREHDGENYRTKTDWSAELFVSKDYLSDLVAEDKGVVSVSFTGKIHTIPNELTRYRYDALLDINKGEKVTGSGRARFQLDLRHINQQSAAPLEIQILPAQLAYVLYTSGSTGRPKGCMLEHRGIVNRLDWMWNALGFKPGETVLQKTTFTFDVSVWEFFLPLCWGNTMVVCNKEDIASPARLLSLIRRHQVNTLHFVPSMLKAFITELYSTKGVAESLESLKRLITSGEALSPDNVHSWYELSKSPLHNLYGPTEASIDVSWYATNRADRQIPIGKPIWNTALYILDSHLALVPIGCPGEIFISGTGLARGYQNQEALTKERFIDHPFFSGQRLYRTGDLGKWTRDGNIIYMGRIDQQVKIRGFRIEPEEIENALETHPLVEASAIIIRANEEGEKDMVAYYVSKDAIDQNILRHHLSEILPAHMIPSFFVHLTEMPLTSSGKANRKILDSLHIQSVNPDDYVAPVNAAEAKMEQLWADVLGLNQVSVTANFFNTGGDSIKALRLLSRVNKAFGSQSSISELYAQPTVRRLTGLIKAATGKDQAELEVITKELELLKQEVLTSVSEEEGQRIEDVYPMSEIEKGMVFETLASDDGIPYHDQFIYHTAYRQFDVGCTKKALAVMIRNHPKLRSVFNLQDFSQQVTIVYRSADATVMFEDLSLMATREQEIYLKDVLLKELGSFKMNGSVLWKLSVYETSAHKQLIVWQFHNAILDGWSNASFITELNNLYLSFRSGRSIESHPLQGSYKDSVIAEIYNLRNNKSSDYWIKELTGYRRMNVFSKEKIQSIFDTQVGNDFFNRLQLCAKEHNMHVQVLCFAAYAYVFGLLSYEDEITVGLTSNTRPIMEDGDKILGCFLNTLPLRIKKPQGKTWRGYIRQIEQQMLDSRKFQLPLQNIRSLVPDEENSNHNPFFDTYFNFTSFHIYDWLESYEEIATDTGLDLLSKDITNTYFDFTIDARNDYFHVHITQTRALDSGMSPQQFAQQYVEVLERIMNTPDTICILDNDQETQLHTFNRTLHTYPAEKSLIDLFDDQVANKGNEIAACFNETEISYIDLDKRSNRLARFLQERLQVKPEARVGILQARGIGLITSVTSILKAGAAYVPLNPGYTEERLLYMIADSGMEVLLTDSSVMELANRMQWRSPALKHLVCTDSQDVYAEYGGGNNELMNPELWNHVGQRSGNAIGGGGWISSYTGGELSGKEMQEYADNVYLKLKDYLHPDVKVLEIGCSSGFTMFRLAPYVGSYYGTDMSPVILEKTRQEVVRQGHTNIHLSQLAAHEINRLNTGSFDLVIINSVIHIFNGYNYLHHVLSCSIGLLKEQGFLFLGDILDEDKREAMISDLRNFKQEQDGKGYRTKTDWSSELFVSKDYLRDIVAENTSAASVTFSSKIHTTPNELTRYRYDALLRVNKAEKPAEPYKTRHQWDLRSIGSLDDSPSENSVSSGNLACILYTSDSPAKPVGCMLEHRGVVNFISSMEEELGFAEDEVILQKTDLTLSAAVWEFFLPLCRGFKMVMADKEEPDLLSLIRRNRITTLQFTNDSLKAFLREIKAGDNPPVLKRVIASGGILSPEIADDWYSQSDTPLYHFYGLPETSAGISVYLTVGGEKKVPAGKPVWNTFLYVLGKNLELLPIGASGEICVAGAGLIRGYLDRPELTMERFVANPYRPGEQLFRTGARGKWLEDGNLLYEGKLEDQVRFRGNHIAFTDLEDRLTLHPDIDLAAVLIRGNQTKEKEIVAYYVSPQLLDINILRAWLSESFPAYMVPSEFIHLHEMQLTDDGGIDRKALEEMEAPAAEEETIVLPVSDAEKKMERIWCDVLGLPRISVTARFFTIGGDSIRALRVLARISKEFGYLPKVGDLYKYQTIAALTAHMQGLSATDAVILDQVSGRLERIRKDVLADKRYATAVDAYPMSDIEKGMAIESILSTEDGVYHEQFVYDFKMTDFDPAKFEASVLLMTRKHEKLRATFNLYDFSEPVSIVFPQSPLSISYESLEAFPPAEQEEAIRNYMKAELAKRFRIAEMPMWRLTLFVLNATRKVVLWQFHHAIMDGWSAASFITELNNIYHAYSSRDGYVMTPLRHTYKDYIRYELGSGLDEANLDFWRNGLGDYKRLNIFSEKQADHVLFRNFGSEYLAKLYRLAKASNVPLQMVCFAAYIYTLKTLTFDSDITVGLVTDNRPPLEDSDKILGCFVNTIPFRIRMQRNMSWAELVHSVDDHYREVQKHPLTLFKIKSKADLQQESKNPFFDTLFSFMDFHVYDDVERMDETTAEDPVPDLAGHDRGNTFLDMKINIYDRNFNVEIDQWQELSCGRTAEHLMETYITVLDSILQTYDAAIDASIFVDAKLPEIQVSHDEYASLVTLFKKSVDKNPGGGAIISDEISLTYKELDIASNQFAHYLAQHHGIETGDLVALKLDRSAWSLVAMYGVWKSGAAYIPVDPDYPEERIKYIISDSECKVVIDEQMLSHYKQTFGEYSVINPENKVAPEDCAYVIYTSGTTGTPKGVKVRHDNVVGFLHNVETVFGWTGCQRIGYTTNFTFDISVLEITGSLCTGRTLCLYTLEQTLLPEKFLTFTTNHAVEVLQLTPSRLRQLRQTGKSVFDYVRVLLVGGEALDEDLYGWLKEQENLKSLNVYGPTETTIWSTALDIRTSETLSVGKPLHGEFAIILDELDQPLADGVTGEICIGGEGVSDGYLNQKELNAAKFITHPAYPDRLIYKTGDLGTRMQDGNIRFAGRKDNQVKIRGYRIELEEIETVLRKHSAIEQAVAIIHKGRQNTDEIIAYISTNAPVNVSDVLQFLENYLPAYMFPSYFKIVKEFPLTFSGKINRNALTSLEVSDVNTGTDYAPPTNRTEERLVEVWKQVLSADRIGIDDNFFLLGGHSLNIMQLIGTINKTFDSHMTMEYVFENPTVRHIAAEIARQKVIAGPAERKKSETVRKITI